MDLHADILDGDPDGEERSVGRVEVVDGTVTVTHARVDMLGELLLIPRFLPDGSPCSMTDDPEAYLHQLSEDLGDGLTLRATPLHASAACPF